jgi:hypothetical protein
METGSAMMPGTCLLFTLSMKASGNERSLPNNTPIFFML